MWCNSRQTSPTSPSVKLLLDYLSILFQKGRSYSCINSHKSAICQTLTLLGNLSFENNSYIQRFLKGVFNLRPPRPRYLFTWDVGKVLSYLESLYPLQDLDLKMLTLKCVALIALASAQRSQTLASLNLNSVLSTGTSFIFRVTTLLKTTRPKNIGQDVIIPVFQKKEICPVETLKHYIHRTKDLRKSSKLFISFRTLKAVTSCSIARWLKLVLSNAGINVLKFKAHSYRSASSSAAKRAGISLNDILKTANWALGQTFKTFHCKDIEVDNTNSNYVHSVFNHTFTA